MREDKPDPAIAVFLAALFLASAAPLIDGADREEPVTQLSNGFTATHSADAPGRFEPVLYAHNGIFAFGFLRVGSASLDLAVVHLPSSFPLWCATPARLADWSRPATLSFDNRLILTVPEVGELWSTLNVVGDTVALLNSSDLVIRLFNGRGTPWRSFENPSDTLVLGQNFTMSSPPLISKNRRFSLRFAKTYMALHMEFYGVRTRPMYWQYTAREAQPENATQPPVYGRLDSRGFFGLYLLGGDQSVDMLAFDTFVRNLTGAFRRMTLDDDGNLRAYYWTEGSKAWTSDYKAISGPCELPTSCGAYSLCVPGGAPKCQCLINSTASIAPPCRAEESTDLCGGGAGQLFDVVRRNRVSLAYKEQLPFETYKTAAECEQSCAASCSCWGAVYNGGSGYCYLIDFPVETVVYEADDRKVGYFKIRKAQQQSAAGRGMSPGVTAAVVVASLVLASLAVAGPYVGWKRWLRQRRAGGVGMEQELTPGHYRDLKSMDSPNNSFKT
ncbi:PAN domain-containing protein At5g03700-like [Triticum dicoccoides]|uniref:PAN domain-containing protein At5g03700-like n=1 Tax=Triticum dicoccoides TaxID=85692 RepID=UPI000E7CDEFE|nr:PAN domain-containing protein At5g03700-like [Triticum dicoccoides]